MRKAIEPPIGDVDQDGWAHSDAQSSTPRDASNRPRKPWLAVVLAFVCCPIAFAYVGRYAWYVTINAALVAVIAVGGWSGWLQTLSGFWTLIGLGVALQIASVGLVWFFAQSHRHAYRLRWYNRWYVYPVLVAIVGIPMLVLLANRESLLGYASYRIASSSMAPTVDIGDMIVVDTRPSTIQDLHVGDIVIADSIRRPGERNLRRIVAMGGQHVLVDSDGLHVDGVLQNHAHQRGCDLIAPKLMLFPDVELDPDELYLMGDNRGNSFDSRTEGPYSRSRIHGKATAVWWSSTSQRPGTLPSP